MPLKDLVSAHCSCVTGRCREERARLPLEVHRGRTRDTCWKWEIPISDKENISTTRGDHALAQVALRGCGVSALGDI